MITRSKTAALNELSDVAGFHQRLARWNSRRLAATIPHDAWVEDAEEDAELTLAEGMFIERARS